MGLLERVAALIRANLEDVVGKADDPEKTIKQVIQDMRNQLLQVKTQVAVAMADQHVLAKKQHENEAAAAEWMRRAELAVARKQEKAARAAVERSLACRDLAASFARQAADQYLHVDELKAAYRALGQKLTEAESKADVLLTQQRRARAARRLAAARRMTGDRGGTDAVERAQQALARDEANALDAAASSGSVEEQLAALVRDESIDEVLARLKARKGL